MSVLIAGVGYHHLRDLSLGPELVPVLQQLSWPPDVEIADWGHGPIAIVQQLEAQKQPYRRMIFVGAVERGRRQRQVYSYRWDGQLPGADEIQQRIGEAVMGVVSLDSLLIIMQHFKVLPPEVFVVEVEPEDCEFGIGLSDGLRALSAGVIERVRSLALDEIAAGQLAGV
jgi:hydrogenase maturation protease